MLELYPVGTDRSSLWLVAQSEDLGYSGDMPTLGSRIKAARERALLSQAELARRLSVASQTVNQWEHGRKNPSRDNILTLATQLSVAVDYLLYGGTLPGSLSPGSLVLGPTRGRAVRMLSVSGAVQRGTPEEGAEVKFSHFPCSAASYWFEMPDDSCDPVIPPGSMVFFDPEVAPTPGSYVLAIHGQLGEPVIGELSYATSASGRVTIITPANKKWPAARSDIETIEIISAVVEVSRKFTR